MHSIRSTSRIAFASGALLLGTSLAACAAPAPSTCPAGFIDAANASAAEQGIDVAFSPATIGDFEPAALQTWLSGACVLGFVGDLPGGHADGHFAFATTTLDTAAFALAVEQLGYAGEAGAWSKPSETAPQTEADVITASTPSGSGTIIDVTESFPEAKHVISSFHFTAE